MTIKFTPGKHYYFLKYGEMTQGYMNEAIVSETGTIQYRFGGYLIDECRVFASEQEASEYMQENERKFWQISADRLAQDIHSDKMSAKAYLYAAKHKQKELDKLNKKIAEL